MIKLWLMRVLTRLFVEKGDSLQNVRLNNVIMASVGQ